MRKYVLFDHDGVLVDTERWYCEAAKRALTEVGFALDKHRYVRDMNLGLGMWVQPRDAGVDEAVIQQARAARDAYYREYLRTEAVEVEGVVEALTELSELVSMAFVTTAKRADFDLIHERRGIRSFMKFVLTREDYKCAKPDPEPYLTGVARFGAAREEVLVVEDSERGLRSAVAAGLDCAIVHNEFTKGSDFAQATYRIESLHQLIDLVSRPAC